MPSGKHAIVTGGSSGIGKATAALLLDRGWRVSLLALEDPLLAQAHQALAADAPDRVQACGVDVTDRDAMATAVQSCIAALGPVDALIPCAGIAKPSKFMDLSKTDFASQMDVNFHGTVNAVRAVYPGMKARKTGSIALISSGAGLMGIFGHTAYAPTKFAVRGFGEALRMEAKPHGIKVSVCFLPDTETPQMLANTRIRPPETAAISGAGNPWSAARIGARIVDGIERSKPRITPGWQMTLVEKFAAPLAAVLRWHFDGIVRRVSAQDQQI